MRKDAAAKASTRCWLAVMTRTIPSPGRIKPYRCTARTAFERPAGGRLKSGAVDFGLRHARIMFDFERREGAAFVTAKPGKTYQRADIGASLRQPGGFGRNIETFLLDPHEQLGRHAFTPRSLAEKRRFRAHSRSRRRA